MCIRTVAVSVRLWASYTNHLVLAPTRVALGRLIFNGHRHIGAFIAGLSLGTGAHRPIAGAPRSPAVVGSAVLGAPAGATAVGAAVVSGLISFPRLF